MSTSVATQVTMILKFTSAAYIMNKTHILNNLVIIEYLAATMTTLMFTELAKLELELHMALFVMVLLITESIMGLSILINAIRTHSNDFLKASTVVKL